MAAWACWSVRVWGWTEVVGINVIGVLSDDFRAGLRGIWGLVSIAILVFELLGRSG